MKGEGNFSLSCLMGPFTKAPRVNTFYGCINLIYQMLHYIKQQEELLLVGV